MRRRAVDLIMPVVVFVMLAVWASSTGQAQQARVKVPSLSGAAAAGATLFSRYCAACHGSVADGSDKGPPLIHPIYEPNHHADEAFYRATRDGARAHHWRFGNMPPVDGIADEDITKIVVFVRTVQKANGIF